MNFIDQKAGLSRAQVIDILVHNKTRIGDDLGPQIDVPDDPDLIGRKGDISVSHQYLNQYKLGDNGRFILAEVILEYQSCYQPRPDKLFLTKIFLLDKRKRTARKLWQFGSCGNNQIPKCPRILKMELDTVDCLPIEAKFLLVDRFCDLSNKPLLMKIQNQRTDKSISDIMKMAKYKSFRKLRVHTEDLTRLD